MLWKCGTQYVSKCGKLSSGHRTGKGEFSFQSKRKAMPKNVHTTALISHASKVMLKILQARLQQYVNLELPGVQAGFRKDRGTRDQISNISWIICQEPARGILPMRRSWGRKPDKMQGCDQASGVPPGISWACTPKTKKSACFSTLLIFSGKSQVRALVFCIWKGCFS